MESVYAPPKLRKSPTSLNNVITQKISITALTAV